MVNFQKRLTDLLRSRKITQRELSSNINVSERLIRYYVAGTKQPTMETLIQIADFFNVPLDYLVGRSDDPTPPKLKQQERLVGTTEKEDDVIIPVERLAAHLEDEYGEHDPEMAKFLQGVIAEVLQDYQEFKRRQAEQKKDFDGK